MATGNIYKTSIIILREEFQNVLQRQAMAGSEREKVGLRYEAEDIKDAIKVLEREG